MTTDAPGRGRRVLPVVAVAVAAVVLIVGGFAAGKWLLTGAQQQAIQPGALVEVHLQSGLIVMGIYKGTREDYLVLSNPVGVSATTGGTSLQVQSFAADPYAIAGNVLVERQQVMIIGAVREGSALSGKYFEALGSSGSSASPQPTP